MAKTPESLSAAQAAPLNATWTDVAYSLRGGGPVYSNYLELEVDLPSSTFTGGTFNAELVWDKTGKYLDAWDLRVAEEWRGHGLGERLTKGLGYIAVEYECERIEVEFAHPLALAHFARVFGEENITYRDIDSDGKHFEVPLSLDQALGSVERLAEGRKLNQRHGLEATVDVRDLDVTGWEQPTETGQDLIEF